MMVKFGFVAQSVPQLVAHEIGSTNIPSNGLVKWSKYRKHS